MQVKNKLKEAVLIFISPPSVDELKNRLINRHTETHEVIEKRLARAQGEINQASQFDYNIINDNLEEAFKRLEDTVLKKRDN
jgi:guanylate kinase